jgi:hypothetical protein
MRTAKPSARAFASVRPTAQISGSVKMACGGAPVVGGVAQGQPVVGQALRASRDHVRAYPGLVLAHVGEQVSAVGVADGVEPAIRDAGGPHTGVHLNRALRLEPDCLQPDVVHVRPAADCHQDLVGFEPGAIVGVNGNGAARDRALGCPAWSHALMGVVWCGVSTSCAQRNQRYA